MSKLRPSIEAGRVNTFCPKCGSLKTTKLDDLRVNVNKNKEVVITVSCRGCGVDSVKVLETARPDVELPVAVEKPEVKSRKKADKKPPVGTIKRNSFVQNPETKKMERKDNSG
jgi:hypothetical protein